MAALVALAVSPLPAALRSWVDRTVPTSTWRADLVQLGGAAAILSVALGLAALAASPFALRRLGALARRYSVPGMTGATLLRAYGRRSGAIVIVGSLAWWWFARIAAVAPLWAGVGLAASLLAVAGLAMLCAPWAILLSPRVRPVRDEAVTGRLHGLASRANLRLAGLHEWVFGPHGNHANAALVGVVGPRRLLLSDTLITGCPAEEVDMVVAHELGHHAHGHTWQRVRQQAVSLLLAVLGAQAAAAGPARRFAGAAGLTDPVALPWMLLGASAVWLAMRPWHLAQSRAHEAEADAFALALTGRPDVLARVLTRLGARNLASDDDSLMTRAFFLTHPPVPARIAAARRAATPAQSGPV